MNKNEDYNSIPLDGQKSQSPNKIKRIFGGKLQSPSKDPIRDWRLNNKRKAVKETDSPKQTKGAVKKQRIIEDKGPDFCCNSEKIRHYDPKDIKKYIAQQKIKRREENVHNNDKSPLHNIHMRNMISATNKPKVTKKPNAYLLSAQNKHDDQYTFNIKAPDELFIKGVSINENFSKSKHSEIIFSNYKKNDNISPYYNINTNVSKFKKNENYNNENDLEENWRTILQNSQNNFKANADNFIDIPYQRSQEKRNCISEPICAGEKMVLLSRDKNKMKKLYKKKEKGKISQDSIKDLDEMAQRIEKTLKREGSFVDEICEHSNETEKHLPIQNDVESSEHRLAKELEKLTVKDFMKKILEELPEKEKQSILNKKRNNSDKLTIDINCQQNFKESGSVENVGVEQISKQRMDLKFIQPLDIYLGNVKPNLEQENKVKPRLKSSKKSKKDEIHGNTKKYSAVEVKAVLTIQSFLRGYQVRRYTNSLLAKRRYERNKKLKSRDLNINPITVTVPKFSKMQKPQNLHEFKKVIDWKTIERELNKTTKIHIPDLVLNIKKNPNLPDYLQPFYELAHTGNVEKFVDSCPHENHITTEIRDCELSFNKENMASTKIYCENELNNKIDFSTYSKQLGHFHGFNSANEQNLRLNYADDIHNVKISNPVDFHRLHSIILSEKETQTYLSNSKIKKSTQTVQNDSDEVDLKLFLADKSNIDSCDKETFTIKREAFAEKDGLERKKIVETATEKKKREQSFMTNKFLLSDTESSQFLENPTQDFGNLRDISRGVLDNLPEKSVDFESLFAIPRDISKGFGNVSSVVQKDSRTPISFEEKIKCDITEEDEISLKRFVVEDTKNSSFFEEQNNEDQSFQADNYQGAFNLNRNPKYPENVTPLNSKTKKLPTERSKNGELSHLASHINTELLYQDTINSALSHLEDLENLRTQIHLENKVSKYYEAYNESNLKNKALENKIKELETEKSPDDASKQNFAIHKRQNDVHKQEFTAHKRPNQTTNEKVPPAFYELEKNVEHRLANLEAEMQHKIEEIFSPSKYGQTGNFQIPEITNSGIRNINGDKESSRSYVSQTQSSFDTDDVISSTRISSSIDNSKHFLANERVQFGNKEKLENLSKYNFLGVNECKENYSKERPSYSACKEQSNYKTGSSIETEILTAASSLIKTQISNGSAELPSAATDTKTPTDPLSLRINTEIPTVTQISSKIRTSSSINTDVPTETQTNSSINSEIPTETQMSSKIRTTSVNTEIPTATQTSSKIRTNSSINTEVPTETQASSKIRTTSINTEVPIATQTSSKIRTNSSINTEIPNTVSFNAKSLSTASNIETQIPNSSSVAVNLVTRFKPTSITHSDANTSYSQDFYSDTANSSIEIPENLSEQLNISKSSIDTDLVPFRLGNFNSHANRNQLKGLTELERREGPENYEQKESEFQKSTEKRYQPNNHIYGSRNLSTHKYSENIDEGDWTKSIPEVISSTESLETVPSNSVKIESKISGTTNRQSTEISPELDNKSSNHFSLSEHLSNNIHSDLPQKLSENSSNVISSTKSTSVNVNISENIESLSQESNEKTLSTESQIKTLSSSQPTLFQHLYKSVPNNNHSKSSSKRTISSRNSYKNSNKKRSNSRNSVSTAQNTEIETQSGMASASISVNSVRSKNDSLSEQSFLNSDKSLQNSARSTQNDSTSEQSTLNSVKRFKSIDNSLKSSENSVKSIGDSAKSVENSVYSVNSYSESFEPQSHSETDSSLIQSRIQKTLQEIEAHTLQDSNLDILRKNGLDILSSPTHGGWKFQSTISKPSPKIAESGLLFQEYPSTSSKQQKHSPKFGENLLSNQESSYTPPYGQSLATTPTKSKQSALHSMLNYLESLQREEDVRFRSQMTVFKLQEQLLIDEANSRLNTISVESGDTNTRRKQRAIIIQLREQRAHLKRMIETQTLSYKQRQMQYSEHFQLLSSTSNIGNLVGNKSLPSRSQSPAILKYLEMSSSDGVEKSGVKLHSYKRVVGKSPRMEPTLEYREREEENENNVGGSIHDKNKHKGKDDREKMKYKEKISKEDREKFPKHKEKIPTAFSLTNKRSEEVIGDEHARKLSSKSGKNTGYSMFQSKLTSIAADRTRNRPQEVETRHEDTLNNSLDDTRSDWDLKSYSSTIYSSEEKGDDSSPQSVQSAPEKLSVGNYRNKNGGDYKNLNDSLSDLGVTSSSKFPIGLEDKNDLRSEDSSHKKSGEEVKENEIDKEIKNLTSKVDNSKKFKKNSGIPFSIRVPLSPRSHLQRHRRLSSESDDSFTLSQNETASDVSDGENKLAVLRQELEFRKSEADKLKREKKRIQRERHASQEEALRKQIEMYDNYIKKTKLEIDEAINETQLAPAVRPLIKKPRVAGSKRFLTFDQSPATEQHLEVLEESLNESTETSSVMDQSTKDNSVLSHSKNEKSLLGLSQSLNETSNVSQSLHNESEQKSIEKSADSRTPLEPISSHSILEKSDKTESATTVQSISSSSSTETILYSQKKDECEEFQVSDSKDFQAGKLNTTDLLSEKRSSISLERPHIESEQIQPTDSSITEDMSEISHTAGEQTEKSYEEIIIHSVKDAEFEQITIEDGLKAANEEQQETVNGEQITVSEEELLPVNNEEKSLKSESDQLSVNKELKRDEEKRQESEDDDTILNDVKNAIDNERELTDIEQKTLEKVAKIHKNKEEKLNKVADSIFLSLLQDSVSSMKETVVKKSDSNEPTIDVISTEPVPKEQTTDNETCVSAQKLHTTSRVTASLISDLYEDSEDILSDLLLKEQSKPLTVVSFSEKIELQNSAEKLTVLNERIGDHDKKELKSEVRSNSPTKEVPTAEIDQGIDAKELISRLDKLDASISESSETTGPILDFGTNAAFLESKHSDILDSQKNATHLENLESDASLLENSAADASFADSKNASQLENSELNASQAGVFDDASCGVNETFVISSCEGEWLENDFWNNATQKNDDAKIDEELERFKEQYPNVIIREIPDKPPPPYIPPKEASSPVAHAPEEKIPISPPKCEASTQSPPRICPRTHTPEDAVKVPHKMSKADLRQMASECSSLVPCKPDQVLGIVDEYSRIIFRLVSSEETISNLDYRTLYSNDLSFKADGIFNNFDNKENLKNTTNLNNIDKNHFLELNSNIDFIPISSPTEAAANTTHSPISNAPETTFRHMLFDLTKELISSAHESYNLPRPPSYVTTAPPTRLWPVSLRFNEKNVVHFVNRTLKSMMRIGEGVNYKESTMLKWIKKKKELVDQILVEEQQIEEPSWINYSDEEIQVKVEICTLIFEDILADSLRCFGNIFKKKINFL